jgi:hypothetical protein
MTVKILYSMHGAIHISDLANVRSLRSCKEPFSTRHKHCILLGPAPCFSNVKTDPSSVQVFKNYLHKYFCVWPLRQYINGGVCKLSQHEAGGSPQRHTVGHPSQYTLCKNDTKFRFNYIINTSLNFFGYPIWEPVEMGSDFSPFR